MIKGSFVQTILKKGKKDKAEKLLRQLAMKSVLTHNGCCYRAFINFTLKARSTVKLKQVLFRGASYKRPSFLAKQQQASYSFKQLMASGYIAKKHFFTESVMVELLVNQKKELSLKRKQILKAANLNKAFANLR